MVGNPIPKIIQSTAVKVNNVIIFPPEIVSTIIIKLLLIVVCPVPESTLNLVEPLQVKFSVTLHVPPIKVSLVTLKPVPLDLLHVRVY